MKKAQLFLLHFAGGNRYSYQFLHPFLKEYLVESIELPGRGIRAREKLLTDFDSAAADVYKSLTEKLSDLPFLIYGHSMGAYLALRVTNMLEKEGKQPLGLIVSGNPGPGKEDSKRRYLMNHDDFVDELKSLGGVPEEIINNADLFAYCEPILRADFEVAEACSLANEPAVNAPIFAIMGSKEDGRNYINNWDKYTTSTFKSSIMRGDHFFIHHHPDRLKIVFDQCCQSLDMKIV